MITTVTQDLLRKGLTHPPKSYESARLTTPKLRHVTTAVGVNVMMFWPIQVLT